jgi:hypothetical protein
VIHFEAALPEQLLDVAVAERIAQIPRDSLQDQHRLEVPTLEVVLGPALQPLDKGVQDHRPPPVRKQQNRLPDLTSRKRQNFATGPENEHGMGLSHSLQMAVALAG